MDTIGHILLSFYKDIKSQALKSLTSQSLSGATAMLELQVNSDLKFKEYLGKKRPWINKLEEFESLEAWRRHIDLRKTTTTSSSAD